LYGRAKAEIPLVEKKRKLNNQEEIETTKSISIKQINGLEEVL
jgi:hypothetical protein